MAKKISLKIILRVYLAAIIVLPAAILISSGAAVIMRTADSYVAETSAHAGYAAAAAADTVLSEYKSDLLTLSGLRQVISTAKGEQSYGLGEIINRYVTLRDGVLDVIVTGDDGLLFASINGGGSSTGSDTSGGPVTGGATFFGWNDDIADLNRRSVYYSDVFPNVAEYGGKDVFFCAKVIRDDNSNAGYCIIVADANVFARNLAEVPYSIQASADNAGEGSIFVADSNGRLVGYGNSEKSAAAGDVVTDKQLAALIDSVKGVKLNSYRNFDTLRLKSELVSYGNIYESDWLWVAVYPARAGASITVNVFFVSTAILAVIMIFAVSLAVVMSGKILSRITKFISVLDEIRRDNIEERFTASGNDEFVPLAICFNEIVDKLSMSRQLRSAVTKVGGSALFDWDLKKQQMYVSAPFLKTFDIDTDAATLDNGKFIDSLMSEKHAALYRETLEKLQATRTNGTFEAELRTRSGHTTWFTISVHCLADRVGDIVKIDGVMTDIDADKKATIRLTEKASFDFLSQLYNRPTFEKEVEKELSLRAYRQIAVMFIDIDNFKKVNDTYGHAAGDEIIVFIAKTLKRVVADHGFAGRFGGDEFVICINRDESVMHSGDIAEQFLAELKEGFVSDVSGVHMHVTGSVGIAMSPQHSSNNLELIACADEAMYVVKKHGKCGYQIYQEGMQSEEPTENKPAELTENPTAES